MLKGLFAGGTMGVLVGGAALTVASLVTQQPAGNAPPAAPQVTAPVATADVTSTTPAPFDAGPTMTAPQVDTASSPTTTGAVTAPAAQTDPALVETAPANVPQTTALTAQPVAPENSSAPRITASTEEPVLPNPQSIAPQVPASEQDLTLSTAPAAPPAPAQAVRVTDPATVAVPDSDIPDADVSDNGVLDIAVPQVVVIDTAPKQQTTPQDITTPAMSGGTTSVRVNRLTGTDGAVVESSSVPTTANPDAPALVRFGTVFENTDTKPLMGILLLDDGTMNGASAAVGSLPFDVTVVIDPTAADAVDRLATYRAANIEVGVLAVLPQGATPTDVEIAFEAIFTALPETVLMLDTGNRGLQNDRAVTTQAMIGLAQDGRGLVTVSNGLNMALRAAEQADVPASVIFRDLDSEGQDPRVIRRFLDQAAFQARQNSGVVLLARVRPDTISALVLWGTANRAGQVDIAPVSAVLRDQQ